MAIWIMHTYGDMENEEAHFDSKKRALEYTRQHYSHYKRITNRETWVKEITTHLMDDTPIGETGFVWIEKREDGMWSNME